MPRRKSGSPFILSLREFAKDRCEHCGKPVRYEYHVIHFFVEGVDESNATYIDCAWMHKNCSKRVSRWWKDVYEKKDVCYIPESWIIVNNGKLPDWVIKKFVMINASTDKRVLYPIYQELGINF